MSRIGIIDTSVLYSNFRDGGEATLSPPVRPKRGIKPKKTTEKETAPLEKDNEDDNKVSFDHEAFSCAVQNILGIYLTDNLLYREGLK